MEFCNIRQNKNEQQIIILLFVCLLFTGGIQFLLILFGYDFYITFPSIFHKGLLISSIVFFFVAIKTKRILFPKQEFILSFAMILWFLIIELQHKSQQMNSHPIGLFLSLYILAFPFAAIAHDGAKQYGLKLIAIIYIAATPILIFYTSLLMLDCIPTVLQKYIYWDGIRLFIIRHPNITAAFFMINIAFCLGFCFNSHLRWMKGILTGIATIMFVILPLTNCRTAILMTCILISGIIFFVVYQNKNKQFLTAAIIALFVTVILIIISAGIFKLHTTLQMTKTENLQNPAIEKQHELNEPDPLSFSTQSNAELSYKNINYIISETNYSPTTSSPLLLTEIREATNVQKSFLKDFPTLNNRTYIWADVFRAIQENPKLLLWGTDNPGSVVSIFVVGHTHNSWLEVLLRLGLIGSILSLIFTGIAIWFSLFTIWNKNFDLWKKTIALLVLCLLVLSFLEPYLFTATPHYLFIDFIFFLCLGYLTEWKKLSKVSKVN